MCVWWGKGYLDWSRASCCQCSFRWDITVCRYITATSFFSSCHITIIRLKLVRFDTCKYPGQNITTTICQPLNSTKLPSTTIATKTYDNKLAQDAHLPYLDHQDQNLALDIFLAGILARAIPHVAAGIFLCKSWWT